MVSNSLDKKTALFVSDLDFNKFLEIKIKLKEDMNGEFVDLVVSEWIDTQFGKNPMAFIRLVDIKNNW